MYTIAIVGAGQIGSRHLQGIAKVGFKKSIYVVDPSEFSLSQAKERFDEVPANISITDVHFITSVSLLPPIIDYAVVSTSSDFRFRVLEALITTCQVKNIVLEKVLYTKYQDYENANRLLRSNNINAWVNCSRREYPDYKDLKKELSAQKIIGLFVIGGDWGLGCNAIHFIDLISFLIDDEKIESISFSNTDKEIQNSKRPGFIEITGSIDGKFNSGVSFSLLSKKGDAAKRLIYIITEINTYIVDELAGKVFLLNHSDSKWKSRKFYAPQTSEIITPVVESILLNEHCDLPTHTQSVRLHVPFMLGLMRFLDIDVTDDSAECLIT